MECINPDHKGEPDDVCTGCYMALNAEYTALNDRYMRLLAEAGELRRKVREAEDAGLVTRLPSGPARYTAGETGFEAVEGTTVLQVRPAREDVLYPSTFHRTTGSGRSFAMSRAHAAAWHAWLGWWLANGWPGVPRRCGLTHADADGRTWQCDQDPDHLTDHEGPCTGWRNTDPCKPGRDSWPLEAAERRARYAAEFGDFAGPFAASRREVPDVTA